MADCLYECLKEASLEKFHKRFCSQGLVSCDELTNLSMHDYATFGIVSMEDRLRLYQLVQIMRSVQHDDMSGNHDNLATRNSTVASSQSNMAAPSKHERNVNQNNRLNVTSEVEVRVCASKGRACEPEHGPTAVLKLEGMKNGLRKNTVVTAKEEAPSTVTFRKGSDSPLFHCRKTLTFSGSDTEEDRMPLEQRSNHNNHVGVATDTSMVDAALQHQTVNDAQNAASGEHCQDHQLKNQNSSENQHKNPLLQHFQFVPLNGRHRSDVETHAYFPVSTSPPPEKITYVETILHSAGYNYGLPNVQTKSPGGTTNGTGMSKKCVERIKVCVRKRPLLAREVKQQEVDIVKMKDHHVVTVEEVKLAVDLTKFLQQHMFAFDEVFDEKCSNEDLYKNTISCLVSSIFERGSATCFAFGQTGAGKTFTLMGTKTVPGLYQLAGRDILDMVHSGHYDNNLHLWISYYEIYCGQLFDLLNKRKRLHVRENGKLKVCISGLMETEVLEAKRLVQVVHYGNSVRSKGSTGVNPTSSRSHAVLQLEVRDSRDTRVGRMSFIDLAGSERASDMTNSNKQTRMEGAEINQSLLALKECIRCIDQDSQHTPYRQSKLTHILRDSFIGNSQTVMIANISPCQSACENTLNTLRYADRVKALKKDTPPKVTRTPSNHVSAKNSKKVAPSLFHPSNIQLSSTPKVSRTRSIGSRGDTGSHGDMIDLTKVLQEAYDTPVRGHRIRVSLSERRRQQRELQKHQAWGANRACVDAHNSIQSIKSFKSFESCESGPPLVVNPSNRAEVNTSHSSSGSGSSKQGAQANGEAHQPTLVWKERRLLNSTQGKPVILRHVAEEASSPGSSSGSVQSDFLRHASRHVKSHDSTGERCLSHSDSHQGSRELSSPDQVKISPSHFLPKSNSKIFEEHKEIMLHLDSVIGRARAVMTKAASRKRIEFTSGLPSNMDAECTRGKTEPNTDALTRIEENFTDAPKSTSVRRKLAWDSDSQALYLNGSQPQNSTGFLGTAVVSLHGSELPTGGATEAANATESETDHLMLPAWATRESVIVKQSSEDLSVTSNASDISFATANSDNVKSVESLNKYNFLGDSWDNTCAKKQTWPQPSNSMMVNGATDGDVEDSGKHMEHGSVSSAFVATDTSHQADKRQQDKDEQSSTNHDKETAITNGSSPTKGDSNDASTHSALPMGNDLLKVLEKMKTVQNQLSEEKVDQLHSVRRAYYEHFPDLLHTPANVRQPCRGFTGGAGCITTQLSTEKIIEKLDAAIEKIASETNIIKKLSPCTLRLKSSQQEGDLLTDKDRCFSVIKGNNAATQQKDGTTSVKKQSCAVNGEGEWKKDVNENFRQGSLNSSEYSPTSAQGQSCDGRSFIFSHVMPVLENITQSDGSITTTDGIKAGSGNKLAEGATGPLQSPKRKDSIGIHEGSAFSKVSDKMVKQQTDSSNSADNRPVAEALKSQKLLQNVNMNGLKYVMSPIRMEKLTGAIFSPIQCFPVTPRDNHVISIPSIVTKTLLKGHSEPVIGDTRPYETTTQLTCGSSEATQSTGDIVTNSVMTRSMLHCLVSSNIDLTGDQQQQKNDVSPVSTGMSAGDGNSGNRAKWETVKQDALRAGNSKPGVVQNVTKTGNLTTPSVQSTVDHSNIPVSAGSPNSCTAAVRDSLAMKSADNSFDQSPHSAVKKFLQSPGSQQSSSRSSSIQSSKETALQRSQNLLVGEHEQKLAEVTTLCKQEMRLLMALRTGDKNFEDYLSILDNILLSKMAVINTLRSHIREFNNVSQTD